LHSGIDCVISDAVSPRGTWVFLGFSVGDLVTWRVKQTVVLSNSGQVVGRGETE